MKSINKRKSRAKSKAVQSPPEIIKAKNLKNPRRENNSHDKQLKAKQGLFQKEQVCSLASTKQKFDIQQSYSEENSLQNSQRQKKEKVIFECVCAKTFVMRKRFQNHLKLAHSFHLMSCFYCEIRDKYEQDNIQFFDHIQQHRNIINLILISKDGSYPIPQELINLFSEQLIQKSKRKLRTNSINLKELGNSLQTSEISSSSQILSLEFLNSLKESVINYISTYQRRVKVFLKNAPLSHLLHIFLINLFHASNKIDKLLRNKRIFFLFEKCLMYFQNFINQRYRVCFEQANIFYNHINIRSYQAYSDIQRTWNINILIRAFLKQLCNQETSFYCFQLFKFVLCAFQEFVIDHGLQV